MTTYAVFFCDDVRQEVSGKHVLIGTYTGNLIPGAVPSTFPMSIVVKVQGLTGKHSFSMQLLAPDGTSVLNVSDELDVPEDIGGFPLIFVDAPMTVKGAGDIRVMMSIDGEPAVAAGFLTVQLAPAREP